MTVSLKGDEAGWKGDLLYINPKTGVEDRLFSNQDPSGTTVVLSTRHDISLGDTVYFVYKVTTPASGNFPSDNSRLPKYTGPNIPGQSKYVSAATSAKAGNPLAPGANVSPATDTVWLVYSDDYNAGKDPVTFNVSVKNRRGAAAPDVEAFTGVVPTRNGITGTWKIAIPLMEAPGVAGNTLLEVFWLGEVTATVASHTRNQIPDGNTVSATLNVAYPDKPETVDVVACPDPAADITRTTTCISVRVVDQNFTRNLDAVWAEVKCDLSGDVIGKVPLIEQTDGSYKPGNIVKN